MRIHRFLFAAATAVTVLAAAPAAHAATKPSNKPCGSWSLWVTNAASAQSWDANGDRLECLPPPSTTLYTVGRDDKALPLATGTKKYSFGTLFGRDTGIVSVDAAAHQFTAILEGQEDDVDWTGCSFVCTNTYTVDSNDLFYLDTGKGSRRISMEQFLAAAPGTTYLSLIYTPDTSTVNVFSLVRR